MFSNEPCSQVLVGDVWFYLHELSYQPEFESADWTSDLRLFMFAQVCLESGNGSRLRGFNVGNIIWTEGCGLPYYEVSDLPPPDPNTVRFRKYSSLRDGVYAYVDLLIRKFRPAVELASLGRWTEATFMLHEMGYFGADKVRYANCILSIIERERYRVAVDTPWAPVGRLWRLAQEIDRGTALTGMDVVDKLGEE